MKLDLSSIKLWVILGIAGLLTVLFTLFGFLFIINYFMSSVIKILGIAAIAVAFYFMLQKEERTQKFGYWAVVLVGAALIFIPFASFNLLATIQPMTCAGSFTYTTAEITTSPNLAYQQVYRITAIPTGESECLAISWDSKTAPQPGTSVAQGSIQMMSHAVQYRLTQKSAVTDIVVSKTQKTSATECTNYCGGTTDPNLRLIRSWYQGGLPFINHDCACIYDETIGNLKSAGDKTHKWNALLSISNAGEATLSDTQLSATIGDKAYIVWQGNYLANKEPSTVYDVFFNNNGAVNMVNGFVATNAVTYANSCSIASTADADNCALAYNNGVLAQVSGNGGITAYKQANPTTVDSVTILPDTLTINTKESDVTPVFKLDLNAAWLGIQKNCGQPTLNCPSSTVSPYQNQVGNFEVRLTNAGSLQGSFSLQSNCPGIAGLLTAIPLKAGANNLVGLSMYSSLAKSGTCSITAYDIGCPDRTSTCTASYDIKQTPTPIPSQVCGNNVCEGSETCQSCTADCGACPTEPVTPTTYINSIWYWIIGILVLLIAGYFVWTKTSVGKQITETITKWFK